MKPIRDALELLTSQHEDIDALVAKLAAAPDMRTLDLLADKLTAHLALEQQMFYPAVASVVRREVLDEVLREHLAMKRVLADLVWAGVDDPWFKHKLVELGQLLCGHTGWQEEELFQSVAECLSAERLVDLGSMLVEHETSFPTAVAA